MFSVTLCLPKGDGDALEGGVPITCDGCKNTLVFPLFPRGFTRYRDATRKHTQGGFPDMVVGDMRVSSDHDRQMTDLQRDALLDAGVDPQQLFLEALPTYRC